jgi:hypothetical protein
MTTSPFWGMVRTPMSRMFVQGREATPAQRSEATNVDRTEGRRSATRLAIRRILYSSGTRYLNSEQDQGDLDGLCEDDATGYLRFDDAIPDRVAHELAH